MRGAAASAMGAVQVGVCRLSLENAVAASPVSGAEDSEWLEPLLQQNAVWFCRLRWGVVGVLSLAGSGAFWRSRWNTPGWNVSPWWPLAAAVFLAVSNLVFVRFSRQTVDSKAPLPVRLVLWAQIVSDLLVLTAVIHWLGHGVTAAPFMYLFHVILACIVFSPAQSLAVMLLAAGFYLSSLFLERAGVLPVGSSLSIGPGFDGTGTFQLPVGAGVGSMLLIWTVIWYLVSRLASALRSRDHALYLAHQRLTASIEERSKHMLQTTHQLKAPFAAIHAQVQLLLGEYCGALPAAARDVLQKMSARCLVLARQIQEMLQLANLRSQGQADPPRTPVQLHKLIADAIIRLEPAARERKIHITTELQPVTISAVEDHLTMLVDNLLLNAVTYSYEAGEVKVSCLPLKTGGATLVIRDQGIGIAPEKLPKIFDDYYRTEEAVQHNRGSTGLGLAIVRQVACKDRVPVMVESAPGWGTRFTVSLIQAGSERRPVSPNSN